jgi:hypothetical protein
MTVRITGQLISPSPGVLPRISFAMTHPVVDPAADTILLPFARPAAVLADGSFELDLLAGEYLVRITVGAKVLRGLLIVPDVGTLELDLADALQLDVVPDSGGGDPGDPGEVTWQSITGKPTTFPPSTHSHAYVDITGKPTTFTPAAHSHAYVDITGKPTTFAPSAHGHDIADVSGLQTALDGKAAAGDLADLADATADDLAALQIAVDGKQAAGDYATNTSLTTLSGRVSDVEGMTPVVMRWNGSAYVEAPTARQYVGGPDPGAVPDGSTWIPGP